MKKHKQLIHPLVFQLISVPLIGVEASLAMRLRQRLLGIFIYTTSPLEEALEVLRTELGEDIYEET